MFGIKIETDIKAAIKRAFYSESRRYGLVKMRYLFQGQGKFLRRVHISTRART